MPKPKRVKRSRRESNENKKPLVPLCIPIILFCVITLIILAVFIVISVRTGGNTAHLLGGIGMLCMVANFFLVIFGIRRVRKDIYALPSRIAALAAPVLGGGAWLYIYLTGAILG